MKRVFGGLGRWIWYLAAALVVACAALVSVGQYYFPYLDDYRGELLARLEGRVPFGVELAGLHAEWTGLSPTFHFSGLRLYSLGDRSTTIFSAPSGEVSIDLARSVLALAPRLRRISAENVRLAFSQEPDGHWHVTGIGAGTARAPANREQILGFFLAIEEVALARAQLELYPAAGGLVETQDARVLLENYHNFRRLRLQAQDPTAGAALDLVLEASGDPRQQNEFEARAHVTLEKVPLGRLQPLAGVVSLPKGALSGELWARVDREGRFSAQGDLRAAALLLPVPDGSPLASPVRDLDARFALDWAGGGGTLWLDRAHGKWLGQELALERIRLDTATGDEGRRYTLAADYLDLGSIAGALQASSVLGEPWAGVLADLSPYGGLADVHAEFDKIPGARPGFDLRARLQDFSASAWKDAPGVRNVQGVLHAGLDGGRVDIDTAAVTLEFPRLYREDLDFDSLQGSVYWRRGEEGIEVGADRLRIASAETGFDAMFRLHFRRDPRLEDEFSLAVGLRDADVLLHRRYVPYVVSSELRQWLDGAIRSGHVSAGEFALRLGFGREDHQHPLSLQLLLDADGASVGYHPDWPRVDGAHARLSLDEKLLRVTADAGTVYDSRIEGALVDVDLGRHPARLHVQGRVRGDLSDGLRVIDTSPLAVLTRGALRNWRGDGAMDVSLLLDMPLGAAPVAGQARIDVRAGIEGAHLDLTDYGLKLEALRGTIDYSLDRGLSSDTLQGTLWGRPLVARIGEAAGGSGELAVQVDGSAAVADLERWLQLSGASMLDGVVPFRLGLRQEGQTLVSRIDSDLTGLGSTLPEPFAKAVDVPLPLSLAWWPVNDGVAWRGGLGDLAGFAIERRRDGLVAGEIVLGATAQPVAGGAGLRLKGVVQRADADDWIATVPRLLRANAGAGDGAAAGFRIDGLRVANASLWTAGLEELRLDSRWEQKDFVLGFSSGTLAGEFRVPGDRDAVLGLRLDHLDLQPFLPATSAASQPGVGAPAGTATQPDAVPQAGENGWDLLRGTELPRINVQIGAARLGERNLGEWQFGLHGADGAVTMDEVHALMPGASLGPLPGGTGANLRLSWPDGHAHTAVSARLDFSNLGAFFDNWNQSHVLEAKRGSGDFRLEWPGGPTEFSLAGASGSMDLAFREGRLLREGSNNPLMRAIGLLRFDELLRRMKFDFKDFYQAGLAFDRFKAPIAFADGVARSNPMVELVGPTARVRLEGRSDLRAERIDANLTVTLPIGSNLPWVAALAGGLPVAAGVFVASRLFEDQIGKLSSAVYSVSGPLDDPKVEFQQVFDVEENPNSKGTVAPGSEPPPTSGTESPTQ